MVNDRKPFNNSTALTLILGMKKPAPWRERVFLVYPVGGYQLSSIDKPFSAFQMVVVPIVVPKVLLTVKNLVSPKVHRG